MKEQPKQNFFDESSLDSREETYWREILIRIPGLDYRGDHFYLSTHDSRKSGSVDFLIFVDSRGYATNNDCGETWLKKLCEGLEAQGKSYVCIGRPKELTTFFTLVNFVQSQESKFTHLITNLGFVELTPKKSIFLDDIQLQACTTYFSSAIEREKFELYALNDGTTEYLYSFKFKSMVSPLGQFLSDNFRKVFFLETLEVDQSIKVERKRPVSFFQQLKATNVFLENLVAINPNHFSIIQLRLEDPEAELFTFDAVHYTAKGHNFVWRSLQAHLRKFSLSFDHEA